MRTIHIECPDSGGSSYEPQVLDKTGNDERAQSGKAVEGPLDFVRRHVVRIQTDPEPPPPLRRPFSASCGTNIILVDAELKSV
jgi:hypothetical protein